MLLQKLIALAFVPLLVLTRIIAALLASLTYPPASLIPILMVSSLYAVYAIKGVLAGLGVKSLVFAFVHTVKQLSQLVGVFAGLRKLL